MAASGSDASGKQLVGLRLHSLPRRNHHKPASAESLVYVFSNLRLAEQLQEVDGEINFVPQAEVYSDSDTDA